MLDYLEDLSAEQCPASKIEATKAAQSVIEKRWHSKGAQNLGDGALDPDLSAEAHGSAGRFRTRSSQSPHVPTEGDHQHGDLRLLRARQVLSVRGFH